MRIGLASFRRLAAGRLGEGGFYAGLLLPLIALAGIAAWFMKSRKTYSRMLVGFVNVNANKAKCSVVTASRL